ncbi:hypothetical protein Fcan01_25223 [Folsomia candida]|uniref:Ionotropic glutamate receptor C-terminal domain-containing protein n=1 Tax=Folsomia candida TaxID=158441 RepID=A0A226D461_FOLCA|nr:hypothetical protein Fcan01_25223 [Folsomia candida]
MLRNPSNQIVIIVVRPGQDFEICFPQSVRTSETSDGWVPTETMGCWPQIYFSGGNYVSAIQKVAPQWEIWCILQSTWEEASSTVANTNRLNGKTKNSLHQLALDVFFKTNITHTDNSNCMLDRHVQLKFNSANPPAKTAVVALDRNDVALVFTNFEGYQFLTCYAEPYISFDFYLSPYQTEAWVALGVSIFTIIALMTIVYHFLYKKDKQPFSAWLFVLASIFEEGGVLPSKVEKATFFRILLGIWSIMSVILTNGYNGIMISELNSPRRLYHPETFNDLACQGQIKNMLKVWHRNKQLMSLSDWTQFHNLVEFNSWVEGLSADLPEFLSVLGKLENDFQFSWIWSGNSLTAETLGDLNLFTPMHSFYPNAVSFFTENFSLAILQGSIEKEVVQCGKTVFIAKSSEIRMEYEFLTRKYPRKKFLLSDQAIQNYPTGLAFQFPLRSRVIQSFNGIVETGIWGHFESEETRVKNFNRTPAIVIEQSNNIILTNIATLNGALPTVFILTGIVGHVSDQMVKHAFLVVVGLYAAK